MFAGLPERLRMFGVKPGRGRPARKKTVRPQLEPLEDRWVLASGDWLATSLGLSAWNPSVAAEVAAIAQPLDLNSRASDIAIASSDSIFFQLVLPQSGNLTVRLDPSTLPLSVSLYDGRGLPIVRSDGQSPTDPSPAIVQGLVGNLNDGGTTYYLKVENHGTDIGTFTLVDSFVLSSSVLQTVPLGVSAPVMVQGDFNGDGSTDLVTGNWVNQDFSPANSVSVLLSNGDGTFQAIAASDLGFAADALVAGDFNGDSRLDLVAASVGSATVQVLLGNGDGTFQFAVSPSLARGGNALIAGDFNGDTHLDLALADSATNSVAILFGDGSGGFLGELSIDAMSIPSALAADDFNDDGLLDLAVAERGRNQISVLFNQGGGQFGVPTSFVVGTQPAALACADVNGDGFRDLISVDVGTANVSILLGDGVGGFRNLGTTYATGFRPSSLAISDLDGDGLLDLSIANLLSDDVTILLGNGDGTFRHAADVSVGSRPYAIVAGDFNGDGRGDLATTNYESLDVSILLGNGNGTFPHTESPNKSGQSPVAIVQADFNGDQHLDLATASLNTGDVSVLLGNGDGTFQHETIFSVGSKASALLAGDFNGDGRVDLLVGTTGTGAEFNTATIMLGDGVGGFQMSAVVPMPGQPSALTAGDFNGDAILDVAVAINLDADFGPANIVQILTGVRGGGFEIGAVLAAGDQPVGLVAGDFDGDQNLDLAVANYSSADVTVFLGNGLGQFQNAGATFVERPLSGLIAGDFNNDQRLDLAVATKYPGSISVLLNHGDGTFQPGLTFDFGLTTEAVIAGDFNGDGFLDLVFVSEYSEFDFSTVNKATVLLGNGQGDFQPSGSFSTGKSPLALTAGDFNGDGRADLATANFSDASLTILLGIGTGDFLSQALAPSPVRSTPLVVNLFSDSVADVVVVSEDGKVLVRRGIATLSGEFAAPVVLNPDPQMAARDVALVALGNGRVLLATLGANVALASGNAQVRLYEPQPDGTFVALSGFDLPAGFLPGNMASADLNGDGLDDLVITASASNGVFVYLQTAPGEFGPPQTYAAGLNPSSIVLTDQNGDLKPDIVIADKFSGQLSVLVNRGDGTFLTEERFRTGNGLSALVPFAGYDLVRTLDGAGVVVAGNFDAHPGADVVVLNQGTQSLSLLSGSGLGGFFNPQPATMLFPGSSPSEVAFGFLTQGDSILDLAVLSQDTDTILIYRGDGLGGFEFVVSIDAGNQPTGISCADVTRPDGGGPDGVLDLLVGNIFGDLLILAGVGDGTFASYRRADQAISLAIANSTTAEQKVFYFSNQGSDRLAYASVALGATAVADASTFQDRSSGIQAPGPQSIVTVQGTQYLVIANSGANEVLIFTLDANGQPILASKQTYFTGTDPAGLTVTNAANDLNGDAIPDLVIANQGSNDISVFVSTMVGNVWTLSYRPRQSSGGLGPTAVTVADITGADGTGSPDGVADILVSNSQSNAVTVLASRGDGYFITAPVGLLLSFQTLSAPSDLFVGFFDNQAGIDLVAVNSSANEVTWVSNFLVDSVVSSFSVEGDFPITAISAFFNGADRLFLANVVGSDVELLLGTSSGFEVIDTLARHESERISDLALVTAGDGLQVYAANADLEVAILLGTFGTRTVPPVVVPPIPGFPGGIEIAGEFFTESSPGVAQPSVSFSILSFASATTLNVRVASNGFGGSLIFSSFVVSLFDMVSVAVSLSGSTSAADFLTALANSLVFTSSEEPLLGDAEGISLIESWLRIGPRRMPRPLRQPAGILLLNLPDSSEKGASPDAFPQDESGLVPPLMKSPFDKAFETLGVAISDEARDAVFLEWCEERDTPKIPIQPALCPPLCNTDLAPSISPSEMLPEGKVAPPATTANGSQEYDPGCRPNLVARPERASVESPSDDFGIARFWFAMVLIASFVMGNTRRRIAGRYNSIRTALRRDVAGIKAGALAAAKGPITACLLAWPKDATETWERGCEKRDPARFRESNPRTTRTLRCRDSWP